MRPATVLTLVALAACDGGDASRSFQGYAEGEYLRMAAPEGGWLRSVTVSEGESVAAGAPLFTLDATEERAAVAEAEARLAEAEATLADLRQGMRPAEIAAIAAQLDEAQAATKLTHLDLERQRELARRDVAAEARLDQAAAAAAQSAARVERIRAELASARLPARGDRIAAAEAAVAAARAKVAQAEWRLSQRSVLSPAAALVDNVARRPGEWVPANGAVVSLLPPEGVRIVFFVPEPLRAAVRPGQILALACDGCPGGLRARVRSVAPEAEFTPPVIYSAETRAKLVYRAEAEPLDDGLLPGQPVTLEPAP